MLRLNLQCLAHALRGFIKTLLIAVQCGFQTHLRFAGLIDGGLGFAGSAIGFAQSAFGNRHSVGGLFAGFLSFDNHIGQLGAALGQIGRHILIAGQFFFRR